MNQVQPAPPLQSQPRCERVYHVDWNETAEVWDVLDEDGRILEHCADEAEATHIAIRQAHHDHGAGEDVIVCAQEKDGGYRVVWTSHRTKIASCGNEHS